MVLLLVLGWDGIANNEGCWLLKLSITCLEMICCQLKVYLKHLTSAPTVSDDVSDLSRRFHNNIQFVWIKSWLGRNFHRPTLALRVLWSITVVINTFQIWKLLNKTSHRQNTSYNPFCFLKDISGELFLNMTNWTATTLSGVFQYYKNSLQVQLYRTYVHYRGDNWQFIVKILIKMVAQVDMIMW